MSEKSNFQSLETFWIAIFKIFFDNDLTEYNEDTKEIIESWLFRKTLPPTLIPIINTANGSLPGTDFERISQNILDGYIMTDEWDQKDILYETPDHYIAYLWNTSA